MFQQHNQILLSKGLQRFLRNLGSNTETTYGIDFWNTGEAFLKEGNCRKYINGTSTFLEIKCY